MINNVHIRRATPQDYPAVANIGQQSQELHAAAQPAIFQHATPGFTEEYFLDQLRDKQHVVYVAETDEQIIGYAFVGAHVLSYLDIFQPRTIAQITDIAVADTIRGRGVGRLLFEAAQTWARTQHAERLELMVWDFNENAIAFYERLGMTTLIRTMSLPL